MEAVSRARRVALGLLALAGWGGSRLVKAVSPESAASRLPVTRVKRGDVTITVNAKGELSGGQTEMLSAPMTGGGDMAITFLREPGEQVAAGDVVVKFDTTEQEYKLKEAEADLAEAEQQVIQTQADNQAKEEETRYSLLQAKMDVRTAELEARRNPILADIVARENTLALEAAKDHLRQLEHDAANRQATSAAAVAIQEAARNKAKVQAETARQNIENMVLKTKSGGYVNVMQNTNCNFCMFGMLFPGLAGRRYGKCGHGGGADSGFEELGSYGQHRRIGPRSFIGGREGPGGYCGIAGQDLQRHDEGDRRHRRRILESPFRLQDCAGGQFSPGMRPGMSSNIVITTGTLPNALWVPSQALFESDSRTYRLSGNAFRLHAARREIGAPQREPGGAYRPARRARWWRWPIPNWSTRTRKSKGSAMKALPQ